MDEMEQVCFQIISTVGTARSMYIEAIQEAKEQHFEEARKLIEEGEQIFVEGHKAHFDLIQKQANGEKVDVQLLLLHAEDQLMSAEAFKIIATEFVDLYEKLA